MYGVTLFGRKLDETGEKAKKMTERITDSTRSMTLLQMSAIKMNEEFDKANNKFGNWSAGAKKATEHAGAWDSIMKQATGHVGEHSLSIGRLERNLAGVTERYLELNPTVGLVGSSLLKFGLGTVETVGILAGIAAIAAAWEYFTGAAKKAREENDKLLESLEKGNFMAKLGPDPDLVLQTNAQRNQLMQDRERRRVLTAFGAKPDDDRIIALNVAIAHDQHELEEGEKRLFKARVDAGHPLDTVVTKAKDYTAELAKQEALLIRHNEQMARMYGSSPFEMTSAQRADWMASEHGRGMSDKERADAMGLFNVSPDPVSMPSGINVNTGLTQSQIHKRRSLGIHLEGDTNTGIDASIAGAMNQIPASIAGNIVSSLLGSAFKGVTGMLQDFFSSGKAAAEQARRMAEDFKYTRASFLTSASGDSIGASILSARKALTDELNVIADRLKLVTTLNGLVGGSVSTAQLKAQALAASAAEKAQEQRIVQYAQEDLSVRNLRALGQGSQADAVAFKQQQDREMQAADARVANAETAQDKMAAELYRNTLATTQQNELLAFQNGLLSTALRNAPTGFYGIEGYAGRFATPITPPGWPGDSGPGTGGPDNPRGGVPPLGGGGGQKRPGLGPLTVNVMLPDGRIIGKVFVKDLAQHAASTNGAGSSLSDALETYPH